MGKIISIVIQAILSAMLCLAFYRAGVCKGKELMFNKVAAIINNAIKCASKSKGE